MADINLGIIKESITKDLTESYLKNENIVESKNKFNDFYKVIKESPILQLEYKIYNNLEKSHISESSLALRYIDDNIRLFEDYSLEDIINENNKLKTFINENKKIKNSLYNAIETLIVESKKSKVNSNPDKIYDSLNKIVSHLKIKKDKNNTITEEKNEKSLNEDILKIALNKFNERYSTINEEDLNLIKKINFSNYKEKELIFEDLKANNLTILKSLKDDENVKEKIQESIKKIKNIKIDENNINTNILNLIDLKNGLS